MELPKKAYVKMGDVPLVVHHSRIRCGSYTAEWIARVSGLYTISSNKILKGPVWFDIFRPVFPSDMRAIFKSRRMNSTEADLRKLTDQEKINWIKREISIKRIPPALLVRRGLLHWIAVAGYDDDKRNFYAYDSLYGYSSINPYMPIGNSIIGYDELIRIWKGRWWLKYKAIVFSERGQDKPQS